MNEKKLTDEELAKAIVQSIEYSKTITYFDEWGNCKAIMMTDILDLIHRLQDENNQIKNNKFASWKLKFFNLKDELKKELAEHEEFAKKANAEIERLTEELDLANETIDRNNKRYERVSIERQKALDRVDYLEDALLDKIRRNEELITAIKQAEQQSVKDTAKEIFTELLDFVNGWFEGVENNDFSVEFNRKLKDLSEKYGVEVE